MRAPRTWIRRAGTRPDRPRRRSRAVVALALAATGAAPAAAQANSVDLLYATPEGKPPLTVPADRLDAALKCSPDIDGARRTPVLLVPGTGVTPEQNYDWNWKPALAAQGIPACTIELPQSSLGELQTAGEYVVHAIRRMHERAGRRISIIGHSQGGMIFRWALRFWRDVRPMVDDAIGMAPSNEGTDLVHLLPTCLTTGCPVAAIQQRTGSEFLRALNSQTRTFEGISYTNIASRLDEVVVQSGAVASGRPSFLPTDGRSRAVSNVLIQDVCPLDLSEHLLVGTTSNTTYALAMDALTHDGPADPARARAAACATPIMPGVRPDALGDNVKLLQALPGLASVAGINLLGVPLVRDEPPLKDYVRSTIGEAKPDPPSTAPAARARPRLRITPGRIRAGRTTKLTVRATTSAGKPLAKQRVRLFGRVVRTNAKGVATLRVRPAKSGLVTARATGNGLPAATKRVRVLRAR